MSPPAPPPYAPPPAGRPQPPGTGGSAGPVLDVTGTAPIPLWRLVLVELRKAVDTLASFWLVVGIAIVVIGVEVLLTIVVIAQDGEAEPSFFILIASYITAVALPVLAIMLVTAEWGQRTAMVTFSIEPRRWRVMLAKYVVCVLLTVVTVVVAIVVGLVCNLICELALPDLTTWNLEGRAIVGFFITQVLAMTLGFALAALLLNTPAAIVGFFIYRFLPLAAFGVISSLVDWFGDVRPYIDFEYAKGPLYDLSLDSGEEWAQLLVAGTIWLALPLVLGMWRILRAEVK